MSVLPPTGTVTFLFTDIQGSTSKWEEFPKIMDEALQKHDEILHKCIQGHQGYVFKTVGDAFCAAFQNPLDCIRAVIAFQTELSGFSWNKIGKLKVRAGIHTGVAVERGGDYYGPTVNKVARIESAAHGGQVLISNEAFSLVRSSLPKEVKLRPLGEYRLKDLLMPQSLYQLQHPQLLKDFPPLKSMNNIPNNIPCQTTEFIGREKEMRQLTQFVRRRRLVTVTGFGGTGKTRLAYQCASEWLEGFSDGVFTIELAGLQDLNQIYHELLIVLGLKDLGNDSFKNILRDYLENRQTLLIFDNCEHLVDEVAGLVEFLLSNCLELKILTTSRELLDLTGELVFYLKPFEVPGINKDGEGFSEFWKNDCVQLFLNRIQERGYQQEITESDFSRITEICRRLDGIPLALELAASNLRTMALEELAVKLRTRLKTLRRGKRGGQAHQSTLRRVIDWSYQLLEEDEKLLLSRLSVFPGHFDFTAAAAICSDLRLCPEDVEDLATRLIDKSLLCIQDHHNSKNLYLLETIREFALEKMEPAFQELKNRFLKYYAKLVKTFPEKDNESRYYDLISRFYINITHVLEHFQSCAFQPDASKKARTDFCSLVNEMGLYWTIKGELREGIKWIKSSLLVVPGDEERLRSRLMIHLMNIRQELGEYQAALELGLIIRKNLISLKDEPQLLELLISIASLQMLTGEYDLGEVSIEECLEKARETDSKHCEARALLNLGSLHSRRGDIEKARECFSHSIVLLEKLNFKGRLAIANLNLGMTYIGYDALLTEECYTSALNQFKELNSPGGIALCNLHLGAARHSRGQFPEALGFYTASLRLFYRIGDRGRCVTPLGKIAMIFLEMGHRDEGALILGSVKAYTDRNADNYRILSETAKEREQLIHEELSKPGNESFQEKFQEGRKISLEKAIRLSLEVSEGISASSES